MPPEQVTSELEVKPIFAGVVPVTPELVSRVAMAIGCDAKTIYRCALLIKQQDGRSEEDFVSDILWGIDRDVQDCSDSDGDRE